MANNHYASVKNNKRELSQTDVKQEDNSYGKSHDNTLLKGNRFKERSMLSASSQLAQKKNSARPVQSSDTKVLMQIVLDS